MRHECPDCGHTHEMKAEERIRRLEAEVARLKAARPYYYSHWNGNFAYPITLTGTGNGWKSSSVVTYNTSTAPQSTLTAGELT